MDGRTVVAGTCLVPVGATLGVEEEFHLVDPITCALRSSPELAAAAVRREFGAHLHGEISTTQLETATGVCTTLAEVRGELNAARQAVAAAAAGAGLAVLAASTHPFGTWQEQTVTRATTTWSAAGRRSPSSRTSPAATCTSASRTSTPRWP